MRQRHALDHLARIEAGANRVCFALLGLVLPDPGLISLVPLFLVLRHAPVPVAGHLLLGLGDAGFGFVVVNADGRQIHRTRRFGARLVGEHGLAVALAAVDLRLGGIADQEQTQCKDSHAEIVAPIIAPTSHHPH